MKIIVDYDKCTGHGVCESLAPTVFEVGDEGVVHLVPGVRLDGLRGLLEAAIAECPTEALTLEE